MISLPNVTSAGHGVFSTIIGHDGALPMDPRQDPKASPGDVEQVEPTEAEDEAHGASFSQWLVMDWLRGCARKCISLKFIKTHENASRYKSNTMQLVVPIFMAHHQ